MNSKRAVALGVTAISALAVVFGISAATAPKEAAPSPVATGDAQSADTSGAVCAKANDSFAQDDSNLLATEYTKKGTADCMFVGCGGVI